jgi:hypothetical protein
MQPKGLSRLAFETSKTVPPVSRLLRMTLIVAAPSAFRKVDKPPNMSPSFRRNSLGCTPSGKHSPMTPRAAGPHGSAAARAREAPKVSGAATAVTVYFAPSTILTSVQVTILLTDTLGAGFGFAGTGGARRSADHRRVR